MAEAQPTSPESNEASLRERVERAKALGLRARQYWKGTFLVLVAGCAISVALALNVRRTYSSECVVLVKPNLKTDDQESAQERAVRLTPKLKDTLLTRSRLEPIIKEFNLYPGTVDSRSMVSAVEEMKSHIGFKGRDSETFVISFEDEDPDRAREITQRLAETTMNDFKHGNVSNKQQEADFLGTELARSEQELEDANRALASFLAIHPEFATSAVTSPFATPPGAQTTQLPVRPGAALSPAPSSSDPQLASLYRQRTRLEAEIKAAGQVAPPPPSETVTSLTKARDEAARKAAQAQADLADKRTKLTAQHPDMIAAAAQADGAANGLRAAEAQLEAAKKVAAGNAPTAGVPTDMTTKLAQLNTEIRTRQSELSKGMPSALGSSKVAEELNAAHPVIAMEIDWARLLRAVGDARAAQEDLRRRSERARLKASASEVVGRGQMEIIDAAYKPMTPKKGRRNTAMAGLVASILAALGYAAVRTIMNDRVYDTGDLQALKLVPILGVIPRLPNAPAQQAATSTAMQAQGQQGVSRVG